MRRLHLPLTVAILLNLSLPVRPATLTAQAATEQGRTRTYYVAADVVDWDYVPGGRNEITGLPFADSGFFQNASTRPVSTVYRKVLYREYTDGSFATRKPRPPEWEHLGFLGPVIHAMVGDTIRVVFRNNGPHPASVHPHGVFYAKSAEGALYSDGTSGGDKADDAVPPGSTYVYVWPVPERAGPGPGDGSSVMWMYHSHTDETRDVNSGLLGVIIVTARGMARPDGSPKDIDREIVMSYDQVHEENSWLAGQNLPPTLGKDGPISNPSELQNIYPYFVKFTINGFLFGSLPLRALTLHVGERVRWYVMSSTNDFDFHAPHWHGNVVTVHGMRSDVVQIGVMEMVVADMVPDDVGTWLFHCHVTFHNNAGMAVRHAVVP